jgi:hypothetical protein
VFPIPFAALVVKLNIGTLREEKSCCSLKRNMLLLFTKKKHADALRARQKTMELRRGSRHRNVRIGDTLSINGHFVVRVKRRYEIPPESIIGFLRVNYAALGFNSAKNALTALLTCYPNISDTFYAWEVIPLIPEEKPARLAIS